MPKPSAPGVPYVKVRLLFDHGSFLYLASSTWVDVGYLDGDVLVLGNWLPIIGETIVTPEFPWADVRAVTCRIARMTRSERDQLSDLGYWFKDDHVIHVPEQFRGGHRFIDE